MVPGPNPINIIFDLEDMEKISRYKWVPFYNGNYTCPFGCLEHIYLIVQKTDKIRIQAQNLLIDTSIG
jgi:hypothetical protein